MQTDEKRLRDVLGLKIPGAGRINYSVKAGAGGGKTTMLSIRICAQILEGTPIEDFVIITYTNAAAAELREKITSRLLKLISNKGLNCKEKKYAEDALNGIEMMQISTIHAFLLKILREYAFESNVVLDVRMLEEAEDEERRNKFFDVWYREHYSEIQAFSEDWIHQTREGREYDMTRQVFQNIFNDLANVREEIVYDTVDHSAVVERYATSYTAKWLPLLKRVCTAIENNMVKPDGKARSLNKDANILIDAVNSAEASGAANTAAAEQVAKAINQICIIVENNKNIYSRCKDFFVDIDTAIKDVYEALPACSVEKDFLEYQRFANDSSKAVRAVKYVCKMQKAYQKQLDRQTLVLSNDDILFRAEKLLKDHADILDQLRKRYSTIYVDEFQDTTGLQAGIIKMLSEKTGTAPTAEQIENDKLLVVGDPKQSIYRFTGAEKAVYDAVDSMLASLPAEEAESVSMDTNFRSNSDIVEWVNGSFKQLMPAGYTAMETDWHVTEQNALHGVYQYKPKEILDEKGKSVKYNTADDVEAVADLVQRLVGKEHCFLEACVRNENGSLGNPWLREIQYSDIMIICRNTTKMDGYVKKFAELGIPVNVQGKFRINDDEVLRNYVLLLDYFANTKDKKKRVTAAQIIRGIDAARVHNDELKAAEEQLRGLSSYFRKNKMDPASIVQYLLSRENLFLPKEKAQKVETVRAYRIRLHQMVETCLLNNDGDLRKLAVLMNEYLDEDVKREIPLESNENAIRLMNAHQAKGLTGQIVIIADRTANENCRYSAFKKDGKYYPVASYKISDVSSSTLFPSFGWDMAIIKQAYKDETEESIRLQYVAATRAAHALIIMPVASSRNEPWFTKKEFRYDNLPDVRAWLEEREADSTKYPLKTATSATNHKLLNLGNLETNLATADMASLAKNQTTSITPNGLEPAGVTGYSPQDAGYNKENRPSGNVFGTIMHRVYELVFIRYKSLIALSTDECEEMIKRLINHAILEHLDETNEDDNPETIAEFLQPKMFDYLFRVIKPIMDSTEEIYPEYTFSFYLNDSEKARFLSEFDTYINCAENAIEVSSGPIWVNGQADLVVKQKDGKIKVYDFKSDAMNGKPLTAFEKSLEFKYKGQLSLYRYAIGKAFCVTDIDAELIHLYK